MSEKQNRARGRGRGRGTKASIDKTDDPKPAILQHPRTTSTSTYQNENASISETNEYRTSADAEQDSSDVFLEETTLSDCWVTPKTKGSKQRNASSVSSISEKKDYNRQCEEDSSKLNVVEDLTDGWNVVKSKPKQKVKSTASETTKVSEQRQRYRSTTASSSSPWNKEQSKSSDYGRNQTNRNNVIRKSSVSSFSTPTTTSQPYTLLSNYFRLKRSSKWYQYRVEFKNCSLTASERRQLMYMNKKYYGGYLYDDKNDFLSVIQPIQETNINTKDKNGIQIQIILTPMGMDNAAVVRILNTIVRRCIFALEFRLIGRHLFDEKSSKRFNQDVSIWPGTITSIRYHKNDILLCAEPNFKFMRNNTVYDLLNNNLKDAKNTFETEVLGKIVYNSYSNKTYKIDDIDWDSTPSKTFIWNGEETSFFKYYKERYKITIKHVSQPLLISNPSDRDKRSGITTNRVLIPELCLCTGLTTAMQKNLKLMQNFSVQTRMPPDQRIQKLLEFNKRVFGVDSTINDFKEWNLEFDDALLKVPAIRLPSPQMYFGGGQRGIFGPDWNNQLRSNKLYSTTTSKNLVIITPISIQKLAVDFYSLIENMAQSLGFKIERHTVMTFTGVTNSQYANTIEKAAHSDPDMIIVFIPSEKSEIYTAVKKKLCVDRAILSQVILSGTIKGREQGPSERNDKNQRLSAKLISIASKIVIQMNSKFGGSAWTVDLPDGLLTIGYDVCHDTSDKSKSVAAIVSTMNHAKKTSYYSVVTNHRFGEEMSNNLPHETLESVKKYQQLHKKLPNTIMIYRDGVGEGQIAYVLEHEVKPIIKVLEPMYAKVNAKPKFAFIVVSKRIRTRLFDGRSNPISGTVVNDVITLPEREEFYLISQFVHQGTVTPTNYNIIHNTTQFDISMIQDISYRMTHLYYNWTGTTRVPAVCQFAHKLAYLAGQTLHRQPHSVLSRYLYFL